MPDIYKLIEGLTQINTNNFSMTCWKNTQNVSNFKAKKNFPIEYFCPCAVCCDPLVIKSTKIHKNVKSEKVSFHWHLSGTF